MNARFKHREATRWMVDRLACYASRRRGSSVFLVSPLLALIGWRQRVRKVGANG